MRCDRRVTHLVREIGWWDFYLVCDKHLAWARTQFPKGMRLTEKLYPATGYNEIATGCVYDTDADAILKRQQRTRARVTENAVRGDTSEPAQPPE